MSNLELSLQGTKDMIPGCVFVQGGKAGLLRYLTVSKSVHSLLDSLLKIKIVKEGFISLITVAFSKNMKNSLTI